MKKTQTKAFANLVMAVIFTVLGIWAYIQTTGFKQVKDSYVQPSTFPRIMIVAMLICSVFLFLQSLYKLVKPKVDDYFLTQAASVNPRDKGVIAALIVIALCILFVALFRPLGYVLDSFIVALVIMILIGKRNWAQIILVSLFVPLLMWIIFYKVLAVNIPMGPLTFLRTLIDKI